MYTRSLVGLRQVGRLNKQEAVCPLLCRVLSASGIRWRSGGSVTLLVLGRTTGIVEPCVYHAFLRRLYSKPVAGGFACGGMGQFVLCARNRAGSRYGRLTSVMIWRTISNRGSFARYLVTRSSFIRAIFPVSGVMVLYDGLDCADFSPVRDVAF